MKLSVAIAVAGALVLAGCNTGADLKLEPLESGESQTYNAAYEDVAAATLAQLETMDLIISETTEDDRGLIVSMHDPVSAFSWGEVGRVYVARRSEPPTVVYALWETRWDPQVTGTQLSDFAGELFPGIAERLPQ
jgi:hypothetical protein